MRIRHALASLALILILSPQSASAWGEKGHLVTNEAATFGLPTDMPQFFLRAFPQLVWLGYHPDRWRSGGPALHSVNPPEHYLDMEYVDGLELPSRRWSAVERMYESGQMRRLGIDPRTVGFLPWRIAELCDLLTLEWSLWRRSEPGPARVQIEQNIIHYSGILGHYVADSANPHHTTIHYNGWLGSTAEGFANDCETHSRFESAFVSRTIDIGDVLPYVTEPQVTDKRYFDVALGFIGESHALVRTLYRLDRDGAFAWNGGTDEGERFAASRLGAGASLLRDLWYSTWLHSASLDTDRD